MANGFLRDFVQIIGIADPSQFPIITEANPNTQFAIQERLTIPPQKPDVEQINSLLIEAVITSTRNIFTPIGVKVVIEGILRQKVVYTADVPEQSVHSAHFEHPFCSFINIPLNVPEGLTVPAYLASLGLSINDILVGPVNVLIEDVEISLLDPRTVSKCVILFAYTTINPDLFPCDCSFVADLSGDVTIGVETVTATLGVSICEGCTPTGNGINLNIETLVPITLSIGEDQITNIICGDGTLVVEALGNVIGIPGVDAVGVTLTIDEGTNTANLILVDPITNTEVLNISLPLNGAIIEDC
ncbi:DUF3794 domain-containing protein [Bacillus weihaiensis]|uniref:DUF3794 domain-containing protein n=1 Tax=Bacillus weihaiensis TaxID=1547283 RepID=UPI00235467CA|nr:DUF3794 domain-containing protein [Bacillus weihaiensis]